MTHLTQVVAELQERVERAERLPWSWTDEGTSPEETRTLLNELSRLQAFHARIEAAHQEHLRTGAYAPLGMAAQDALLALKKEKS